MSLRLAHVTSYPKAGARQVTRPVHGVLFLHGLLGNAKNWMSFVPKLRRHCAERASAMSTDKDVHTWCYDARNHGASPHHADHSIDALSDDVQRFLSDEMSHCAEISVVGHSMGAATLLHWFRRYGVIGKEPRLQCAVSVDMPPLLERPPEMPRVGQHMKTMLGITGSRVPTEPTCALDMMLAREMESDPKGDGAHDRAYRQFLLTNAKLMPPTAPGGQQTLLWRCNLPALLSGFPQMPGWRFEEPHGAKIDAQGKLAFALGEQSPYSTGPRRDRIQAVFDNVKEVVVVEKCPHWVHIVRGEELAAVVAKWMVV